MGEPNYNCKLIFCNIGIHHPPKIFAIGLGVILLCTIVVYGGSHSQDDFPLPILSHQDDFSKLPIPWSEVASIQLGPGFEKAELKEKHLILFKVISLDSLDAYSTINESSGLIKKSVERVTVAGWMQPQPNIDYHLTDWRFTEDARGNRLKCFFGAFPSEKRFVVGCGIEPLLIADDGEILESWYPICECSEFASSIEEFPGITTKGSPESTLTISLSPVPEADEYGVIIWSQQPTYESFFERILFSADFSSHNLPATLDTSLPSNHDYFIAVWAKNKDTTEESRTCWIQPFYVMDLVHFEKERPTKVQESSWGQVKANFKLTK